MITMWWPRRALPQRVLVAGALAMIVGAGGVGIEFYSSINMIDWQQVAMMPIVIFAVVVVSEFVSAITRLRVT